MGYEKYSFFKLDIIFEKKILTPIGRYNKYKYSLTRKISKCYTEPALISVRLRAVVTVESAGIGTGWTRVRHKLRSCSPVPSTAPAQHLTEVQVQIPTLAQACSNGGNVMDNRVPATQTIVTCSGLDQTMVIILLPLHIQKVIRMAWLGPVCWTLS